MSFMCYLIVIILFMCMITGRMGFARW